jgi:hypothetical protein
MTFSARCPPPYLRCGCNAESAVIGIRVNGQMRRRSWPQVMSKLAITHNSVNLGQGFPDDEGPDSMKRLAGSALIEHHNQASVVIGLHEGSVTQEQSISNFCRLGCGHACSIQACWVCRSYGRRSRATRKHSSALLATGPAKHWLQWGPQRASQHACWACSTQATRYKAASLVLQRMTTHALFPSPHTCIHNQARIMT